MTEQTAQLAPVLPRSHPGRGAPPLAPVDARIEAYIIDAVIAVALTLPLTLGAWWFVERLLDSTVSLGVGVSLLLLALAQFVLPLIGLTVTAVLSVVVPSRMRGMTIGKRLMCIRVTRDDCSEATWHEHALRCLGLWADGIAVVLPGLLLVNSRPDRKRLGDMLARTVVVVAE